MTGSPAESGRLCTIFRTPAGRQRSTGGSRDETRHRLCQCPAPSVSVPRSHTAARLGSRSVTLPPAAEERPEPDSPIRPWPSQARHCAHGPWRAYPPAQARREGCQPCVLHTASPRPSACQSSHTPAGLHGSPSPDGVSPKK